MRESTNLELKTRQSVVAEGYFLGCQLRRLGATSAEWMANAEVWSDGPRGQYRGHELRSYFAKGLEAGYRDLASPDAAKLDH
jgi:hypothetical protein